MSRGLQDDREIKSKPLGKQITSRAKPLESKATWGQSQLGWGSLHHKVKGLHIEFPSPPVGGLTVSESRPLTQPGAAKACAKFSVIA